MQTGYLLESVMQNMENIGSLGLFIIFVVFLILAYKILKIVKQALFVSILSAFFPIIASKVLHISVETSIQSILSFMVLGLAVYMAYVVISASYEVSKFAAAIIYFPFRIILGFFKLLGAFFRKSDKGILIEKTEEKVSKGRKKRKKKK